ncbi:MAG: amino acid ABC transporter [Anaerolineaceae bacterium]|nr:amino acid ABC transporter [Anaerolineaceae bacterium]
MKTTSNRTSPSFQSNATDRLANLPWWAIIILLAATFFVYSFITNELYQEVIKKLVVGIRLTLTVTITAYIFAITIGLLTGLGQLSSNIIIRNAALLYVQVIRGVPIIVQIFYTAFVIVPAAIVAINLLGVRLASTGWMPPDNIFTNLSIRDVNFIARGIIALALSYGAFSAEIFRAGIQSISTGQIEAAQALGLTRFQSLKLIILPQAIRRVLPPLGNDFIAMLKESSLVSVLGVNEITHLGKKYAAASFRFPETYNTLAFLYLSMTLILSMGVKAMERKFKTD